MEAVLAGALRREQEAEFAQNRQAAEIEQLTRLVSFIIHQQQFDACKNGDMINELFKSYNYPVKCSPCYICCV